MPLTDSEKSARKRQKKRDAGLVLSHEWVTPQQKIDFKLVLEGKAKIVRINPRDKYDGVTY